MQQRIYHGTLSPEDVARCLVANFHRGNLQVQQIGSGDKIAIQIATTQRPTSGGQTALGIQIQKVADGVSVSVGQQTWAGIAASLSVTALHALRNPFALLSRLDDLAQDVEYIQLHDEIWKVIDREARASGASFELSERLKRIVCAYCGVANPVGEPSCITCGAPLGAQQPRTCLNCGFVIRSGEQVCPNCGKRLVP